MRGREISMLLAAVCLSSCTPVLAVDRAVCGTSDGSETPVCQSSDGKKCLDEFWDKYCCVEKDRPKPEICEGYPGQEASYGRKWLALDSYCADAEPSQSPCVKLTSGEMKRLFPAFLIYDHASGSWRAACGLEESEVTRDINGVPTALIPAGEELFVDVENTNSLLYSLVPADAKEEQAEFAAEFATLAQLFGGFLSSVIRVAGEERAPAPLTLDQERRPVTEGDATLQAALKNLQATLEDALASLEKQTSDEAKAITCIQQVENRRPGDEADPLQGCPTLSRNARSDLVKRFDALAAAARKVEEARKASQAASKNKSDAAGGERAPSTGAGTPLEAENAPKKPEKAPETQEGHAGKQDGTVRGAAASPEIDPLLKAREVLSKRDAAVLAAARLDQFAGRLEEAQPSPRTFCDEKIPPGTRIRLKRHPHGLKWDKVQVHQADLKIDSPYAAQVVASRPAQSKLTYKAAWWRGRVLGVGAGTIYTPLADPKWSAGPDSDDPDAKTVVKKSDEENRSGKIVLFLNWRLAQHVYAPARTWPARPGLEFGFGVSQPSDMALFAGGSLEIGKYMRLGAGWTWQKVQALDGVKEGAEIPKDADIRTKDDFRGDWYVSLSLAIDSLKFFSGK